MKNIILIITGSFLLTMLVNAGEPYKAGDLATDFSLRNINGSVVSLSQFEKAKGFIIVFMCI